MDLFTVDTVGEQKLLDQEQYSDSTPYMKDIKNQNIIEKTDNKSERNDGSEDEDIEANYDYRGD